MLLQAVVVAVAWAACPQAGHTRLLPAGEFSLEPVLPSDFGVADAVVSSHRVVLCRNVYGESEYTTEIVTFDDNGHVVGTPISVQGYCQAMATDDQGHWMLLAWDIDHLWGGSVGVRVFDPETSTTGEFVALAEPNVTLEGALVYAGNGVFVAAWHATQYLDPPYSNSWSEKLFVQRLDVSGGRLGAAFRFVEEMDYYAFRDQIHPSLASNGAGVVAAGYAFHVPASSAVGGQIHFFDSDGVTIGNAIDLPGRLRADGLAMSGDGSLLVQFDEEVRSYGLDGTLLAGGMLVDCPYAALPCAFGVSPQGRWLAMRSDWPEYSAFEIRALNGDVVGPILRTVDERDPHYPWMQLLRARINEFGSVTLLARTLGTSTEGHLVFEYRIRRYCDTGDPACDRCQDSDDAIDADYDDIPDGCDRCVNVAAKQDATNGLVVLSSVGPSSPYNPHYNPRRTHHVRLTLEAPLPAGTSFSQLPVVERGMRLRIQGADGTALTQVVLSGGVRGEAAKTGWTAKDRLFRYAGGKHAPRGFKRVVLRDTSSPDSGSVRIVVRAAGYERYGIEGENTPLRAIVGFGDESDASLCTELQFDAMECRVSHYLGFDNGTISCERD